MNARTCRQCWGGGQALSINGEIKTCPGCDGTGTVAAIPESSRKHYRKLLRLAINNYLYVTLPDSMVFADINNLTEQSLDAIDSVVHSYPPLMSTSRLASGS